MAVKLPPYPDPEPRVSRCPGFTEKQYEIHVVTPLFGGGARAGEVDETMPVRGSSIRGHLRFWWRATQGAAFSDPAGLREQEKKLFGSTDLSSPLQLTVRIKEEGRAEPCIDRHLKGPNPLFADYAVFPFRPDPKKQIKEARSGLSFLLTLRYPSGFEGHYRNALWAWINFGGLGARTRRGCGSLWCQEFSPTSRVNLGTWLSTQVAQRIDAPPHRPTPVSTVKWPLLGRKKDGALEFQCLLQMKGGRAQPLTGAWISAVEPLKQFRQWAKGGPRGRSEWPEAETIRESFDNKFRSHPKDELPALGFPRAEFGLPIVFYFKDTHEDPPETQLKPRCGTRPLERMASPLVVKPLAISPSHGVPMIVRLRTDPLRHAALYASSKNMSDRGVTGPEIGAMKRQKDGSYQHFLDEKDIRGNPFRELTPMKGHGSALDAFWEFAKSKGFVEVGS